MRRVDEVKIGDSIYVDKSQLILLMLVAYLFSVAVRLLWVDWAMDHPEFFWNGQLMISTNDGYFFASGVEKKLFGLHLENPRVPDLWRYGTVFITYLIAKITPFSLESVILYLPAFISSLVVIPIILIARLYNKTIWGFFSAMLASIIWSYYNRTMIGYYDTDMFSAMAPMFILYFFIKSTLDLNLKTAFFASLMVSIYPFLYDQGRAIVFAMGIIYALYLILHYGLDETIYKTLGDIFKKEKRRGESLSFIGAIKLSAIRLFNNLNITLYQSLILIFVALTPFHLPSPYEYLVHIAILAIIYLYFKSEKAKELKIEYLIYATVISFVGFLILGDVFTLIWHKASNYIIEGTKQEGDLHFFAVNQTVREAGKVLFFPVAEHLPYKANIAHRMMGSSIGLVLALIGYLALVWRHRAFILALPLIGIGVFAHWGGLRFTVYAVPIAGMSALFLFQLLSNFVEDKFAKLAIIAVGAIGLLIPNIKHIQEYKVPTVLNKSEVADLDKLNKIASSKDYTITWWDYGYPVWFYSDTSTLIDGGKHDEDNFIVSTILQSDSPTQTANLARLSVETYVKSDYKRVANELFKNQKLDPNELLAKLRDKDFKLPPKTRDIYLYLPYRMLGIFTTVMVFGNLDLTTGKKLGVKKFITTAPVDAKGNIIKLSDGSKLDLNNGLLVSGSNQVPIKRFVGVYLKKDATIKKVVQSYHKEAYYTVVYLKSYGRVIIMNDEVFNSTYVQMFLLGNYDKSLFELVVKSPYSRIYRLKI